MARFALHALAPWYLIQTYLFSYQVLRCSHLIHRHHSPYRMASNPISTSITRPLCPASHYSLVDSHLGPFYSGLFQSSWEGTVYILPHSSHSYCSIFRLLLQILSVRCLPVRRPIFFIANPHLHNVALHLIFRFLTGFAGSAFLSVSGGSISDMFTNDQVATYVCTIRLMSFYF